MNSKLYNKTYKIPSDILYNIRTALTNNPRGSGVKRAKYLSNNGIVTYQSLKRLKNFFDYYNGENPQQFELAGGNKMKTFVNQTLQSERDAVKRGDNIKKDVTNDPNLGVKAQKNPRLNEVDDDEGIRKNALGILVNDDRQILLVKRNPNIEQWQPGKWALVGGGVEDNETPEEACIREIKEEVNFDVKNIREKCKLQRNSDSTEYIFIGKFDNDPHDIKLNHEHINYGWFYPEEMVFINHVPNLIDYINLAFKNYD